MMVLKDHKAKTESQAPLGQLVQLDPKVRKAYLALLALLAQQDRLDRKVHKAMQELQALLDRKAPKGRRET